MLGVVMLGALTAACAPYAPGSPPQSSPPASAAPDAAPTAPAGDVVRAPAADASADVALAPFAKITDRVWASERRHQGRAYVDALVDAGFSKERMQVTADRSTVDNPAESIQFSVAWNDSECLVGQVGPSTGEPTTAVLPRLVGGACLAGKTRPIDW